MNKEPNINDPDNPLISVFIYKYSGLCLRECFAAILDQDILNNIEIVYLDNASTDGAWEIALEYVEKYPQLITISRNKCSNGTLDNYQNLIKGKYCISLGAEDAFMPDYFSRCIKAMEADPLANFDQVTLRRKATILQPPFNIKPVLHNHITQIHRKPLVSITVHNYNYGRYLRECLESVFSQAYDNIEVCFSDNASTDDSWHIALEFANDNPGKMYLTRNRRNFGADANVQNNWMNVSGKYLVYLCSDDVLAPGFVEKCVDALEAHLGAGYAMVHRAIIDEYGTRSDEPPFYNQSCVIAGPEQAAVYMLAAVNPCISQVMYRVNSIYGKSNPGSLAARWYGTRILDFNLCCEFDMVYLREPLLLHRLHSHNDSFQASENLIEVIAPYILQHQLAETAAIFNLDKAAQRLPQAIEKLSNLCLRYCVKSLCSGNETAAERYFHLAIALLPQIRTNPVFVELEAFWFSGPDERARIFAKLAKEENLATRSVSYDPPPGSIPLG